MMNLFKKFLLFTCVGLLTQQISWSQTAVITSYNCTGSSGSANISITPTTGITSYTWRVTGTTAIIAATPTSAQPAGSYTITVVKNGVPPLTLSVTVAAGIIPTSPSITPATVSSPVCGSGNVTLNSTAVSNYIWKRDGAVIPGTTNSILATGDDVNSPGTYSYTVTNTNNITTCTAVSNAVVLTMSPTLAAPTVSAADGTTLICGSSTQTLSANGGGASYVWRRDLTTLANTGSSLLVNGNDATGRFLYTAAIANSTGCPLNFSTPGVSLTLSPAIATPTITTPVITTPVCGTSTQTLTASSGGASYVWRRSGTTISGSTNSITVTGNDVSVPNTYNYTVSTQNAAGCVSSESAPFALKVSPKPTAPSISPSAFTPNVICGLDSKKLTATPGGTTYTWKRGGVAVTGSTTNILDVVGTDVSVAGTYIYSVSLTNSVGCISDDSPVSVTLQLFPSIPAKPIISASGPVTFCEGGSVILNYTRGVATDVKIWSRTTGADTTTTNADGITVRSTNTFTLKTKDANGCSSLASNPFLVTVNIKPSPPIIDKGTANAICDLDSITLISNNKGTGGYLWSTGRTTTSITVKSAGSYSLTYTDANSCTSLPSFPFVLTINQLPAKPTITNLSKSSFCFREFTTLRAASATIGATFEWDYQNQRANQIDVSGSSKKTVDEIIEIRVRAVSAFTNSTISSVCKSRELSDKTVITVKPLPTTPSISTSGPITFCPDSTVSLISTDSPNGIYKWINVKNNLEFSDKKTVLIDTTTPNIITNSQGNVTVQAINGFGCLSKPSQGIEVRVNPLPDKPTLSVNNTQTVFCDGSKVRIVASSRTVFRDTYWWRSTTDSIGKGEDANSIFAAKTGNYFGKVQDDKGCISLASAPIAIDVRPNPTPTVVKKIGAFSLDAQGIGDENGYVWRYNGDVEKDLTTRIIKAKKDGNYQVQASITYTGVALAGGKLVCYSNTSQPIKYEQDPTFNGFSIFPNPTANGEINIEVLEDLFGATVMIYSMYGQLITEYKIDKFNTLKKIQLPEYHGNSYIIRVTTDGFEKTRRVINLKQ